MLSLIRVKNYAVIDEVELEFSPGFSVMTGETGAGKSILVDALGLALGDRADSHTVRQGAERAEISVLFDCPAGHRALAWLGEQGLDEEQCCLLRRVVGAEGRSRAFINSHPVTLQDLRTLGALLLDIHGQHAHQSMLEPATQRMLLDAHGNHLALAERVGGAFQAWRAALEELEARRRGGQDRAAQLELLRFQAGELERLGLAAGEVEHLQSERSRLANVDRLMGGVTAALSQIYEADVGAAHALLAGARQELTKLLELDAQLRAPAELLGEAEIQLREAALDLTRYRDRLELDPERLDWVEERLAKVQALTRRHQVAPAELEGLLEKLQARIEELAGGQESLEALTRRAEQASEAYYELARKLSDARKASARDLAQQVSSQLGELGLPHGEFRIELEAKAAERADATGLEHVEYQVKLNPGQPFGALARMASGGELSRISLAIEVVGAGATQVPTLIFDEVDAGIGGGVAEIVGRRLSEIARERQVLCVTHLAQVASQGEHHFRVSKLTDGKTSRTNVRALCGEERVEELSRMLGGVEITERARAHAAEMMDRAAK